MADARSLAGGATTTSAIINGYDTTNYTFAAGDYLIVTNSGVMAGSSPISGQATNIGTPSSSRARGSATT